MLCHVFSMLLILAAATGGGRECMADSSSAELCLASCRAPHVRLRPYPLPSCIRHRPLLRVRGGSATATGVGCIAALDASMSKLQSVPAGESAQSEEGMGTPRDKDRVVQEDFWVGGAGSMRRPWGKTGENLKMGNEEAVRRFREGACVLVLDFPAETDFGIDVRSWTVSSKFKGLKMVPAGIHLLYWDAGHGLTQGMWFHARPSQVLVLQWDASIEDFAPTEAPGLAPDQLERLVAAVGRFEFDSGLAGTTPNSPARSRTHADVC